MWRNPITNISCSVKETCWAQQDVWRIIPHLVPFIIHSHSPGAIRLCHSKFTATGPLYMSTCLKPLQLDLLNPAKGPWAEGFLGWYYTCHLSISHTWLLNRTWDTLKFGTHNIWISWINYLPLEHKYFYKYYCIISSLILRHCQLGL